jgi:hypothetical protein
MRTRRYRSPRNWSNRRITVLASAVVAVAALGIGTGMSYAGQNGQGMNGRPAADPNPNCSLVVPANPLSAQGLATPYQLVATDRNGGACHEADSAQAAFVQASVVDPATGKVSVYNPLVIDRGRRAAVKPVVPVLPKNAVVGIWFGYNGDILTLKDSSGGLTGGACVNGLGSSLFTQFAYCNAPAFFTAANAAIKAGKLTVPPLGTGKDGNLCPTTRDFTIVDQDQSDNVTSAYLIQGRDVAQDTAANRAKMPNATVQVNGSDNLLLVQFVDRAVGCKPFTAPDLADHGAPATSLALDELQAATDQGDPVAIVPPNDPMTEVNGHSDTPKLNLYRQGVDMSAIKHAGGLAASYCQRMVDLQPKRLEQDRAFTETVASPDPGAANNLFTFLAQRLSGSFDNLGCGNLVKGGNPVKLKTRNGVAINASFAGRAGTSKGGKNKGTGASASPSPSPSPSPSATTGGATVKDAFTPTAPPPATSGQTTVSQTTASQTTGHRARNGTSTAAAVPTSDTGKPARTVKPDVTAPKANSSGHIRSGGGPVTSAANGEKSANDYGYPSDDGVANSGTQAPAAADVEQGNPAARDVPTAKKSGILALTGANSMALIVGSVTLILVAISITALTRRRRPRGRYY